MTAGAPWSVKGIDPKAREIAKDLARRSGMTLGEWLNQVILEDGPIPEEPPPPRYAAYGREAPAYRRIETPEHPGDELSRVTEALERLSSRIEAAENRSTLAISGVDQTVAGLVSRLNTGEREQTAVAARFESLADDLKTDQGRIVDRMRRIEQEAAGPRSVEALRAMESALGKVAGHLYDGEARTREQIGELRADLNAVADRVESGPAGAGAAELVDNVVSRIAERLEQAEARTSGALRGLEVSFAHLDERLGVAESKVEGRGSELGLEHLAASLTNRVDAARAEMAEKIRASADGKFDRMERTLAEMNGHVQAAERRSAQAIERMGHEVLRMAETLGRRVGEVEHTAASSMQQVTGEMSRIANAMDTRLTQFDAGGAQALEKLGGEIARITERLAERIANAERRSAQAIDDVGDQMTRVSERLQDRQERTSTDLAERIRQSEERTARLLEDARERIDSRLAETQRRANEPVPAPAPAFSDPDIAPFGQDSFSSAPLPDNRYSARGLVRDEPADREPDLLTPRGFIEPTFGEPRFDEPAAYRAPDVFADPAPFGDKLKADLADPFDIPGQDDDAGADDGFLKIEPSAPPAQAFAPVAPPRSEPDPRAPDTRGEDESIFAARPTSTRELIEQARAAARGASGDASVHGKAKPPVETGSLFSGFGMGRDKKAKRIGGGLGNVLLVTGFFAVSGVAALGYELMNGHPTGNLPQRVAEALGGPAKPGAAPSGGEMERPIAAVALNPTPLAGTSLSGPGSASLQTPTTDAAMQAPALYAEGARRIEGHDNSGIESLRKAANLGYAPAEFYLAKLYEDGQSGLTKDLVEARRWTQRAAEAGDKKAMHNLALYYFEGTGGPKNLTQAAQWFRRAADLGLVDSQYNLGRLYEEGFGVSQNPAEAYKWYLIAQRSGDTESRNSAQRIKGQLSVEAQTAADRAAQAFRAQSPGADGLAPVAGVQANAGDPNTSNLQHALSRLGYYQGPSDGQSSPALKLAIAAYQRDQGLPTTGALDGAVVQRLTPAAQ
jgi:localization factor PodJL